MTDKLFTPVRLGAIEAKNRIFMAPLTRNRARAEDDAPYDIHAEYYGQRAGAGLIIAEATQITPEGKGYAFTPGIHSAEQVAGWRQVTDAVHERGGSIVLQLWHVGRISHVSLQPDGQSPVAPSAIAADAHTFDGTGFVEVSAPRALGTEEIPRVVEDYRRAAENAKAAGFDGVEVHAANGYLLDQFLRPGSNHRTDGFGGSPENRARLVLEVVDAVTGVIGADRTGIRLSPMSPANGQSLEGVTETFDHLIRALDARGLAFLHMVEGVTGGTREAAQEPSFAALRKLFSGAYVANNGYDRQLAVDAVESGWADAVAFGRPYIANPDLAERLFRDAPLNEGDRDTYYGGGREGYTDYPALGDSRAA